MDTGPNLIWAVGCLILVGSALVARRAQTSLIVKSALGWVAIFAVVGVVVAYRGEIGWVANDVGARLGLIDSQRVQGRTVEIAMSDDGHFWVQASINGVERRMLVDSGATTTALSTATAEAVGIETNDALLPEMVDTANGLVPVRYGTAAAFNVGPLRTAGLEVAVSPNFGSTDVVGMNFLSRLGGWRIAGRTLILEPSDDVDPGS